MKTNEDRYDRNAKLSIFKSCVRTVFCSGHTGFCEGCDCPIGNLTTDSWGKVKLKDLFDTTNAKERMY